MSANDVLKAEGQLLNTKVEHIGSHEFPGGVMVVMYDHRSQVPPRNEVSVSRRLAVYVNGVANSSHIIETRWEKP